MNIALEVAATTLAAVGMFTVPGSSVRSIIGVLLAYSAGVLAALAAGLHL